MTVFCRDCKYQLRPSGALYKNHPNSLCTGSKGLTYQQMNFVTGELETPLCKSKNKDGHCPDFTPKGESGNEL